MSVVDRDAAGGDWAELRRLAEEGRYAPLLGGRPLVAYGIGIVVASLWQAAVLAGLIAVPAWTFAVVWAGAMTTAGFVGRPGGRTRTVTLANRVERQVWAAGGSVLALAATGILLFGLFYQARLGPYVWLGFAAMPPLTFGVYAIALNASATAGDQLARLRPFVGLSIAFMIGTVLLGPTATQLLALAAGALLCSVWPGALLLRRERG